MSKKKTTVYRNVVAGMGLASMMALVAACGGSGSTPTEKAAAKDEAAKTEAATPLPGMITADQIVPPLEEGKIDQAMVAKGKEIYDVKCLSCHSLGTNRVVGPGWEGIMKQRTPEWIMNMILHTDAMLETDPEAQAMLEECLVRMPNQNLTNEEARDVLEFMRTL